MSVNVKKPVRLQNRTKYFSPSKDKSHVTFGSASSYQSRRIKIEGYESRLYWQFRYCQDHNGQTFFYTLTYNDKHIPKYMDINCFDYEDLRDLLTGGFRKHLLRKYGTTFKYFIGAELGDGKGQRGFHNNPHYHVLFFLESADSSKYPYLPISSEDFRHLVRLYWQGFDEDTDGYHDFRDARYGIAKEGENCGLVIDFRACMYCAKYVCKDAKLKAKEFDIESRLKAEYTLKYSGSLEFHKYFIRDVLYPLYNTPLNPRRTEWSFNDSQLVYTLIPDFYSRWLDDDSVREYLKKDTLLDTFTTGVPDIITRFSLLQEYGESFDRFIKEKVKESINVFRNRYCNKCRISHGVGDYALDFIADRLNPSIQVPAKKGFKNRPISQYYYRKLFTDVVIDKKHSPIRVLNEDGIKYKLSKLHSQLDKKTDKARSQLALLLCDRNLYESMYLSDVNTDVGFSFDVFIRMVHSLNDIEYSNLLKRYAEFKLVYEDRFFPFDFSSNSGVNLFPDIDVNRDYERFLCPSIYSVSRSDTKLSVFLEDGCPNHLPYSQHPYFLRYISLFRVLDLCSDYFFVQLDNKEQSEADEIASVKRYHKKLSVSIFFNSKCL